MIEKNLFSLLSHSKKYIAFHVIFQWLSLISQIIAIFTLSGLLEMLFKNAWNEKRILCSFISFVLVIFIRYFSERAQTKLSFLASVDVKRILREKIYEKMLKLGTSYKEQVTTSEIVQIATEGVEQLEIFFGKYLPQLFYCLLAPLTLFFVLSFIDMRASLVLLTCVPLIPISIVIVQKIAKKLLNKYWTAYTELGDSFLENLQGLTTLKIYQADEQKAIEMDQEADHFRKITMKVLTMQLNSTSIMDIIAYGGATVGMLVAINSCIQGQISLYDSLIIILLASEFFLPMRLLGSYFHIAMNGMAASNKIFKLLNLPEPKHGTFSISDLQTTIIFTNANFSYQNNRQILNNITLTIPHNSLISIVGESGSGKSTIANLLTGKNKNYTGSIKIGNIELSDIKESSLMRHVNLISHNSYLFKGTVRDNLLMANPNATDTELINVLKKVTIWDFLLTQNGLDTLLAERASNISGGQKQRIALARTLLTDASIYIFDEATSNIDCNSEEVIMKIVKELSKSKTVILISHRLANVITSNCIYMLCDGNVIESGTHEELLSHNSSYAEMYYAQQKLEQYQMSEGCL